MKNSNIERAMALLICAALAVSLAACGKDNKKKAAQGKTQNSDTIKGGQDGDDTVSIIPFDDDEDEGGQSSAPDDDNSVTTTTTTNTTAKKTTAASTKATTSTVKRDNSYKIVDKKYSNDDGSITFTYPQITGLYDKDMQDFYNELFKSDANKAVSQGELETFSGEYKVTLKNKDKLSIVFRCSGYMKGGLFPSSYAYAYTIDLSTGETVNPFDSINISKAADSIVNNSWTLVRAGDGVSKSDVIEYFNQFNEEEMKSFMSVKDVISVRKNSQGKYTVSGVSFCNSYFDGTLEPVLILEVSHAMGDYIEAQF